MSELLPVSARLIDHDCQPRNPSRISRALASGWREWSHGRGETWARAEAEALERIGMRALVEPDLAGGWLVLARPADLDAVAPDHP